MNACNESPFGVCAESYVLFATAKKEGLIVDSSGRMAIHLQLRK